MSGSRFVVHLAVAVLVPCGAPPARAQSAVDPQPVVQAAPAAVVASPQVTAGAEMVYTSAYVWRGFVPTDRASFQPTLWVRVGDLTVTSWFNMAGNQPNGALTEHDFTVDWSKARGAWTLSGGWIHYAFPGLPADGVSSEFYGGVTYAGFLNPSVKVFQDVQAGSGTYISLGVGHTLTFARGVAVAPAFTLGYNHQQWIDDSGWSDANVTVKLLLPTPQPRLWLSPFVAYSKSLDAGLFPSKFYGGLSLAVR